MVEKSQTYFQQLTSQEKASKLSQLARGQGKVVIWEKGSKNRQDIEANEFVSQDERLLCVSISGSPLVGKTVLYSFELNGLSFFGTAELKFVRNDLLALEAGETLFKSERRESFRLLTFPHHKVFLHVKIKEEEASEGNVVGIKSGVSETGLFKNFLNLIKGNKEGVFHEGHIPFRVLDLSVSGASLQLGEMESVYFKSEKETGKLFLDFNGEEVEIPNAVTVYNVDMVVPGSNTKAKKVGLKFLNIDTNLDQRLGKLINGALRDFETEFEDFVK